MLKRLSLTLAALLLAPALEAAEGTRLPDRPTLMLFDRQNSNGKFVIPLLFLKEVPRDGSPEGKEVVFQFAETRRVDDPETPLESAWYRLYDYDRRLGLGPERGGCDTFDRLARGARCTEALLPAIEWVSGVPRLLESRRIPYPKSQENYFIYRDNAAFHVELRLEGSRAAFRFAEYAPIRDLFQASGSGRPFLLEGEPDTAIPVFSVPGDVRPIDAQNRELRAVCYPNSRTSLQAVVTFGDPQDAPTASTREEDRRLFFDLGRRPGDLVGPNPVPESQPPSWLLSLPLRHAFFATSDTVAEIVLPPGAFRRLASIALAPDGRPYERQGHPEELFVGLGAEFDLNKSNTNAPRRRVLRAANLEQRAILERLGGLGTGTADADLHLGPSDWLLDSAFRPHETTRSFQDLKAGGRTVRLRDRVLHRPSGGSFRLILGPEEGSWFYIQETEVSIRQWRRFLESSAGVAYLRTLAEPNPLPPGDPLEKFLPLLASRMGQQNNLPSPTPEETQTPRKWEIEISADMPMVFLSPESAEKYNAWLGAGSVEARLPKLEEWRQAARLNDLRAAIEAGAQVGDLVWVGQSKPHILLENVRGAWRSHETLISMVGNVAELVTDGAGVLAVGASFRTRRDTETVLHLSRAQEPQEASVFVGLRPVLVPKMEPR